MGFGIFTKRDNFELLTRGKVSSAILIMGVPAILTSAVTSLNSIADSFFVGKISTQAMAAVGISYPILMIIKAFGNYCGYGSGSAMARRLGAGDTEYARKTASVAIISSFYFGLIISILGLLTLKPLCSLIGASPTIMADAMKYLGFLLPAAPFMTMNMTLSIQLRLQGYPDLVFVGVLSNALIGLILVPSFAFLLDFGIAGAAMARAIGEFLCFLILLAFTFRGKGISPSFKGIRLQDFKLHLEISKSGTPSLTKRLLTSLAGVSVNIVAGGFGDAAIAGISLLNRVTNLLFSVLTGLGQGFQPLCGYCYGAGKIHRIKDGLLFCLKVSAVYLFVTCIPVFIFAEDVIKMLRNDPEVIDFAATALRYTILTFPCAIFVIMSNYVLQTSGKIVQGNILASVRTGIFYILFIFALPVFLGKTGVQACQAVSNLCSFGIAVFFMLDFFRAKTTDSVMDNKNNK